MYIPQSYLNVRVLVLIFYIGTNGEIHESNITLGPSQDTENDLSEYTEKTCTPNNSNMILRLQ